VIEVTVGGQQ